MIGVDWHQPLPPEVRDEVVEKLAGEVVQRGLTAPAIFFLEMHRPVSFIASQAVVVGSPVLGALFGIGNAQILYHLLADKDNLDRLVRRIELMSVGGETGGEENAG